MEVTYPAVTAGYNARGDKACIVTDSEATPGH
jgi:hypothetical protein